MIFDGKFSCEGPGRRFGSQKMKSLLISKTYFPPYKGGISHYVGEIAKALGPRRVCCLTAEPGESHIDDLGISVYRNRTAFESNPVLQSLGLARSLGPIFVRERPRIIQLATVYEGYLGLWMRTLWKFPFVIYAHGNEVLETMHTSWPKPRIALQTANHIFAASRFTAGLVEKLGVDPSRITIVNPGCDLRRFQPLAKSLELKQKLVGSRNGKVLLTVGGLVARKGQDMVLRCLPALLQRFPDLFYLIAGDGPYRAQLEALVEDLGLREHVRFLGKPGEELLPEIYALSDVFVMPSRQNIAACDVEGFGLVYLEASACEKPIVAGNSGGIPDAVIDGRTGLLVNPTDPREIGEALGRILGDGVLAETLGKQGRMRLVHQHEWENVAARVHSILENIVGESGNRHDSVSQSQSHSHSEDQTYV